MIGLFVLYPNAADYCDEGMGYYTVAYEIYNLALILSSYSLPIAVSKLISARETKGDYKNSYRIFSSALVFAIIVGPLMSSILYFGAEFYSTVLTMYLMLFYL